MIEDTCGSPRKFTCEMHIVNEWRPTLRDESHHFISDKCVIVLSCGSVYCDGDVHTCALYYCRLVMGRDSLIPVLRSLIGVRILGYRIYIFCIRVFELFRFTVLEDYGNTNNYRLKCMLALRFMRP